MWYNLFGHRSAQSALFSSNDQNAPSQPKVDRRSNKVKILKKKNTFHGFSSNLSFSEIFGNFYQVWPEVDPGWAQKL